MAQLLNGILSHRQKKEVSERYNVNAMNVNKKLSVFAIFIFVISFDFDIYDNWVYLSDYLMNGALIKINIADHSVDLVGEYGTPAFCVNKNRFFYIPEPDQGNKLPSKLNIYQVGIDGKNAVKITESYK